jgi:hypothetical protein
VTGTARPEAAVPPSAPEQTGLRTRTAAAAIRSIAYFRDWISTAKVRICPVHRIRGPRQQPMVVHHRRPPIPGSLVGRDNRDFDADLDVALRSPGSKGGT